MNKKAVVNPTTRHVNLIITENTIEHFIFIEFQLNLKIGFTI